MSISTASVTLSAKRIEAYAGTTDANGDYIVVFPLQFPVTPHINPVGYPGIDSDTRVRIVAASASGFTIRTEKSLGLTVLGLTVLGFGSTPFAGVPVRVLVVES